MCLKKYILRDYHFVLEVPFKSTDDVHHKYLKAIIIHYLFECIKLREKCPYSELFWSDFPAFGLTSYLSVFSPNAEKYRLE